MRQRSAAERFLAMAVLGGIGAQELAARRRVEVELVARSPSCRSTAPPGCRRRSSSAVDFDAPRVRLPREREVERQRATPRRCCASASPRKPSVAIASRSLAPSRSWTSRAAPPRARRSSRSMPPPSSATRISLIPPPARSTSICRRAGVEAVLEELLQRRGRPLDDFAGGDLVDQLIGQRTDRRHQRASPAPSVRRRRRRPVTARAAARRDREGCRRVLCVAPRRSRAAARSAPLRTSVSTIRARHFDVALEADVLAQRVSLIAG